METIIFYSIRIFKRGEIEIFTNVFKHKISFNKGIEIVWSSTRDPANCTHSMRPIDSAYKISIIEEKDMVRRYLPEDENVKIIINR